MSAEEKATPKKLPKFSSLQAAVDFVERTDLGDYLDGMPEAKFEVRPKRITIDADLYSRLDELARARHVAPEGLIETWLKERLSSELAPASR